MKKFLRLLSFAVLLVACGSSNSEQKDLNKDKYEATWESLAKHQEIPEWLSDAKLGMYFHWGLYTVPEYGTEWYPYYMYRLNNDMRKHHDETYGEDFEYHQFADMFTAKDFDPVAWAKLFKETGAKFAGPSVLHCDGYSMWDSDVNPWNTMDTGPKRDITGELLAELKKEGIKSITTFHNARNMQRNANKPEQWGTNDFWSVGYDSHFAYLPNRATSSTDPKLAKMYGNLPADEFHQYWFDVIKEVVDKYSPDMIWFDSWLNLIPEKFRQEMAAYYYNEAERKNQAVTIGFKEHDMPLDVCIKDIEQGGKKEMSERAWMTDITLSTRTSGWSYSKGQEYKDAKMVIRNMVDVWSKNGIVLLNISPTASGIIPEAQRKELRVIGQWLKKYGEAVYGTVPFRTHGYGTAGGDSKGHNGSQSAEVEYTENDVRFTCSKDYKTLYMFILGKPEVGKEYTTRTFDAHRYPFHSDVKRVTVMGTDIEVDFKLGIPSQTFKLPDAPYSDIVNVLKFELE